MNIRLLPVLLLGLASTSLFSCKDKDEPKVTYTVPDTYTFENVEYKEAAARVSMWSGYTRYLGKGSSYQISRDTVTALWNNAGAPFTADLASSIPYTYDVLNTLSYNLSGKTADAAFFSNLADSMVATSAYTGQAASDGVPGKIGTRLFNYTGLEYNQAIAKGLMGGLVMYNVSELLKKVSSDDNANVVDGQGTAMQHDWDLAFGYIGVPANYDTSFAYTSSIADRPLALGGYFAERAKYIQAGGKIYEAFRTGRAAIVAADYDTRDKAIATINEYIEKTIAAAMYHYVTAPQTTTALDGKFHGLSEGYGFALALKYRPASSPLTPADYQTLMSIMNTSFYELANDASNTKLKQAQSILTATYGQLQP